MRVMQIVSGAHVNGAVVHATLLCRALASRGHEVTLVCRPGAWIAAEVAPAGVAILESPQHRSPAELWRISREARLRRVDVIHTHQTRSHNFGVLMRRLLHRIPTVATAHARRFQPQWCLNDAVIAPSRATARFLHRPNLVPWSRLEVIHNFLDTAPFEDVAGDARQRLRRVLDAADDDLLVGVVGAVIPGKGLDVVVRALPALRAACPRARVVVIGDGETPHGRSVRDLASRLGVADAIRWLGFRQDVPECLAALDLVAHASRDEQMPMAVLEAMAAGLPVVATAVGGVPECVVDGETGLLVAVDDVAALSAALVGLAGDGARRAAFARAAARRARQSFTADAILPAIERMYARVAALPGA